MAAFWNRKGSIGEEEAEFDAWLSQMKEPPMSEDNRRLAAEITALRNEILTAQGQHYIRRRQYKITQIRRDLDTLKGMVFAWLYVSGKYNGVPALREITPEVNDLAMLYLSVDLIKMLERAFPPKAPRDV